MPKFLWLARGFLAWLCRISRFLFAVLWCSVYPLPLFNVFFFCACVYFCQKTSFDSVINGCGHTWDLTLVKGFNRGKKDVKNFTIVKPITWLNTFKMVSPQKCVTQMMSLRTGDHSYDIPWMLYFSSSYMTVHHAFTENCAAADTASIPLFSRPNISGPCWITSWPWLSEKPPGGITKLLRNGGTLKWKELMQVS